MQPPWRARMSRPSPSRRATLWRGTAPTLLAGLLALSSAGVAFAQGDVPDDVIPDLVPKAELPLVPETEVNTAYAPNVPPPSGRTTPAIVEVEFEIVEDVNVIDPAGEVTYETWGYKLAGDDDVLSGTPGPLIRARFGDVLR